MNRTHSIAKAFNLRSGTVLIILYFLPSNIFGQNKWQTIKPSLNVSGLITLIITHSDCESCMDAQLDKGSIVWPDSVSGYIQKNVHPSMIFSNRALTQQLFGNAGGEKFNYSYMVTAKVIQYYRSNKAHGYVPVIDVYQYRFLKEKEPEEDNQQLQR